MRVEIRDAEWHVKSVDPTSDFSTGAIKEAAQSDKTPIALMNGDQLVMLLMEHGIGVHRSTPDLFEIDEEARVTGEEKIMENRL